MAEIVLARLEHLEEIMEMYRKCTEDLDQRGIYQWDERYPNRKFFEVAIEDQEMYLVVDDSLIKGGVVLNDWQIDLWQEIPWAESAGPQLVIHALAIHPEYQGQGYGRLLLNFAEEFAKNGGYTGIRLDAFTENPVANNLYLNHGYTCKGQVYCEMKREPYNWYFCYEKVFDI